MVFAQRKWFMLKGAFFRAFRGSPYFLALTAVAASTAVRFALDPVLHTKATTPVFLCGIVVAALVGGLQAGLVTTGLSILFCDYFFIEPRYTFLISDARGDLANLAVFLVLGVTVSIIIGQFRQFQAGLRKATMDLEQSELRFRTMAATVPEMLFAATVEGEWTYVSPRFCAYTGLQLEQLHENWTQILSPDEQQGVLEQWTKSVNAGTEFESANHIRRADGEYRWFKCHAIPVRGADNRITQWTGICADIHEAKVLEQALTQRTAELAAANEQFLKFAYRISHDLDGPLRTIRTFTELLVKDNHQSTEKDTFSRYILEASDHCRAQVQQLLEYAKIGSIEFKTQPVELAVALESALADLRSTIFETRASVTHDALPCLILNPDRITSVFQNLIANALKYRGADPPRVHVSASRTGDEWIFSVRDNGVGFEMAHAERIFKEFERLSRGGEARGSGLGLAIVKRIVEIRGGRVWAESRPGKGSTFFFSLPGHLERIAPERERQSSAHAS